MTGQNIVFHVEHNLALNNQLLVGYFNTGPLYVRRHTARTKRFERDWDYFFWPRERKEPKALPSPAPL